MFRLIKKLVFICILSFLFIYIYPSAFACAEPQIVFVGLYLNNVNDVDMKTSTYTADFYLWFRWKGNIDPSKSFEFLNTIDQWSTTQPLVYEEPRDVGKGYKYQVFHVQGKFNNKFILVDYPLDKQNIIIALEDSQYNNLKLRYIPDMQSINYNHKLIIPGWKIIGQEATCLPYKYETTFGDPTMTLKNEAYSRFEYSLSIIRPQGLYLFKMLLPVIIVLLSTFIIFFMHPKYVDARTCIAITTLVSVIALQITVSSDVGYMVLMDKIYNLSYIMILLALIETIITTAWLDKGILYKAIILDRWAWRALTFIYIILTTMIISWR